MQLLSCQGKPLYADVSGVWEGTLHTFGQDIRLIYAITVHESGTLGVVHHSPDYGLNNIPISSASQQGNRVIITTGLYEATFEGTLEGEMLRGRYGTPGLWTPLILRRKSPDPHFLLDNMVPRLGNDGKRITEYQYAPAEEGEDGWVVGDASREGVDMARIEALMGRVLREDFPNLHSILVVKDGKLLLDEDFYGFHPDTPHRMASIAKIVPEALTGLLLDRHRIDSIHVPLVQLFPEYRDLLGTGEKAKITLYHLLTMTTGLRWNEHAVSYYDSLNDLSILRRSPDPVRSLFERPLEYSPGERFVYNSGCVIALESLIQKITKAHFLLAAQNDLFTPLGISRIRWDYADGLFMLPRDMAKLGWLFLHGGTFNGSQVLPSAWVDSALQRFEHAYPRYFNHWWPIVFFVGNRPLKALQAGGWGGQSVTIFPSLNTVIVLTAGAQLQQVDFDYCIRDYLLPAIITPEYLAKHLDVAYSHLRRTKNLSWEMRWNTEMGCLKASAKSLGVDITDAQLYGATGVGFLICIDARAEAKSSSVWNWHGAYDLCRNLGFSVESIWSHKSNKDFGATQKRVWDRVRQAIDSGYACYGFHLENPIRSLIIGYDDIGYYHQGWEAEHGKGPVCWYELGRTDIGLLGMHFVRPAPSTVPSAERVKRALQFVLAFSANSPAWVPGECKAGPEGYARWISLLESGTEDAYGTSYLAADLAESRGFAVRYLEEAKSRLNPELTPLLEEAGQKYARAAQELDMVCKALPHTVPAAQRAENRKDPERRKEVIQHLRGARDAEIEGLKVLARIVERL